MLEVKVLCLVGMPLSKKQIREPKTTNANVGCECFFLRCNAIEQKNKYMKYNKCKFVGC